VTTSQSSSFTNSTIIRMALRVDDQPEVPLAMETFINVTDTVQRADYAAPTTPRSPTSSSTSGRDVVPQVLAAADDLLQPIPAEMEATSL
jgi:hypothetical protein